MNSIHNLSLDTGSNELEVIEFYIEEEQDDGSIYRGYYGINVAKVLEIIQMPQLTKIPSRKKSPTLGTFNLRGRIIPLIDLSTWLNKKMIPSEDPRVIVCEFSGMITAFLVTGVERIYRISWEDVEAPTEELISFSSGSVIGVIRIEERILFLLDMEYMLQEIMSVEYKKENVEDVFKDSSLYADGHRIVLFVDDSASIRKVVSEVLIKLHYTVLTAFDGKEAWKILVQLKQKAEQEGKPLNTFLDCIVTDIEMPEMDGHTLTKRIKEDSVMRTLPVILYSSIITSSSQHKGERVGADYQINKTNVETLARQIKTAIASSTSPNK
ncbi:MAG: chemotaxis protein [Desulfovibrionaceae bacterium]|nr:chemotaxis protein [Desulfovibrionaceae bacterium]